MNRKHDRSNLMVFSELSRKDAKAETNQPALAAALKNACNHLVGYVKANHYILILKLLLILSIALVVVLDN